MNKNNDVAIKGCLAVLVQRFVFWCMVLKSCRGRQGRSPLTNDQVIVPNLREGIRYGTRDPSPLPQKLGVEILIENML